MMILPSKFKCFLFEEVHSAAALCFILSSSGGKSSFCEPIRYCTWYRQPAVPVLVLLYYHLYRYSTGKVLLHTVPGVLVLLYSVSSVVLSHSYYVLRVEYSRVAPEYDDGLDSYDGRRSTTSTVLQFAVGSSTNSL